MIGILLAGGFGTRLRPLTKVINKHLLPVYDKPMIYYSLSVLLLAKIKHIIIISNKNDVEAFKSLLNNGQYLNIKIEYIIQPKPLGIPDAFRLTKKIVKNRNVCLILGDNFFYGQDFTLKLLHAKKNKLNTIFTHAVSNPSQFGILEYYGNGSPKKIIEKPIKTRSFDAVTGLYFYTSEVFSLVEDLKFSKRGELEITDINNYFLKNKKLNVIHLGRGYNWLDLGTFENLHIASQFVSLTQKLQGLKIASLKEIAYNNKWINKK